MRIKKYFRYALLVAIIAALSFVLTGALVPSPADAQSNHTITVRLFLDLNHNGTKDCCNEGWVHGAQIYGDGVTGGYRTNCVGPFTSLYTFSNTDGYAQLGVGPLNQALCVANLKLINPTYCWTEPGQDPYRLFSRVLAANASSITLVRGIADFSYCD